jgi:hypothetical protein
MRLIVEAEAAATRASFHCCPQPLAVMRCAGHSTFLQRQRGTAQVLM